MCLVVCKLEVSKLETINNVNKESKYLSIIEKNNTPRSLECGTKIHVTSKDVMLVYCKLSPKFEKNQTICKL